MAGRPTNIDPTLALEQAMLLFWEHGYTDTSLAQLEKTLGAGRQSIYNTFGDKKTLFIKAYQHYLDTRLRAALALLQIKGTPQQRLRNLLHNSLDCTTEKHLGCFIGNTLATPSSHHAEINTVTEAAIAQFIEALKEVVIPLFDNSKEAETAAWSLFTTFQGAQLIAKQPNTREHLLRALDRQIEHLTH